MQLIKHPNPILKQKAVPWDFETDTGAEALEVDMVQLMIENNGIGLAANQVGLLKRVFAIRLKDQVPFCMFNPGILVGDNAKVLDEEGCLSFPDLFLRVPRDDKITAMYLDRQGNKCIIELSGIDSRCFQHELDHLDGVCFTEHISSLKLALAQKKLQKQKRKYNGRTK
jgi:peptide deformylase